MTEAAEADNGDPVPGLDPVSGELAAKFARWSSRGESATGVPWLSLFTRTQTTASQCYVYEPNPKGRFSRDRFSYDAEKMTLSCPGGEQTREAYPGSDGEGLVYRFGAHQCGPCKLRDECTSGDFRSVKVPETVKDWDQVIAYGKTE